MNRCRASFLVVLAITAVSMIVPSAATAAAPECARADSGAFRTDTAGLFEVTCTDGDDDLAGVSATAVTGTIGAVTPLEADAHVTLTRAVNLARDVGDDGSLAFALATYALMEHQAGSYDAAWDVGVEAIRTCAQWGEERMSIPAVAALAGVLQQRGDDDGAALAVRTFRALHARHSEPLPCAERLVDGVERDAAPAPAELAAHAAAGSELAVLLAHVDGA